MAMKARKVILLSIIVVLLSLAFTSCRSQAEKELERAQEAADAAEKRLHRVEADADRTNYLIDEYNELQRLIPTLPEGSIEKERAISRNNQIVRQLMDEYPELVQYVEIN